MTRALLGLLLLFLAGGGQAADGGAGVTASDTQPRGSATERRAGPTAGSTGSVAKPAKAARSAPRTSESYKADLAACRRLSGEERRNCEREVHTARAEGLYRE